MPRGTLHSLGLTGIGITDRNIFAGVVRGHIAAREVAEAPPNLRQNTQRTIRYCAGDPWVERIAVWQDDETDDRQICCQ